MARLFASSLRIPAAQEVVFEFFSDAHNLESITPPELRFHILTPEPIIMRTGLIIDYRLRLFGVPFHWQTKIAGWHPPDSFIDKQMRGPYALWVHTHSFETAGDATLMHDQVEYANPWYAFGPIGDFFIRRQIQRIFAYRNRILLRVFDAGDHRRA